MTVVEMDRAARHYRQLLESHNRADVLKVGCDLCRVLVSRGLGRYGDRPIAFAAGEAPWDHLLPSGDAQ